MDLDVILPHPVTDINLLDCLLSSCFHVEETSHFESFDFDICIDKHYFIFSLSQFALGLRSTSTPPLHRPLTRSCCAIINPFICVRQHVEK